MVAIDHTTAEPPTSVMNSRRRMSASDEAAGARQTSILKEGRYVFGLMSALPPKADIEFDLLPAISMLKRSADGVSQAIPCQTCPMARKARP